MFGLEMKGAIGKKNNNNHPVFFLTTHCLPRETKSSSFLDVEMDEDPDGYVVMDSTPGFCVCII